MHPFRLVVGLAASALVLSGWAVAPAVAQEDPAASVRISVVRDTNGAAPGGLDIDAVQVPVGDAAELTAAIEDDPGVLSAEADTRVAIAEDPYASQQYSAARVRADRVRGLATGDGTVVAVVDSGVQGSHPDLSTSLPGGRARVLPGTTFLTPPNGATNQTGTPGNVDDNGHGTHVAGIIAAARGNGIGVEGIAPDAQILPVRALDSSGFGWATDVANAILWAHDQGADVINLSLAGPDESPAVSAAIDWVATDASRGKPPTIVVAAAGNSGTSYAKMWPAAHPRVISVASSDRNDQVASTSSRGTYVDVAAPGVGILSTCTTSTYCYRSGTSMAAPLVAGTAALLREQDPRRAGWSVETVLRSSAYDIASPGTDAAAGAGRLDVATALDPTHFPRVPRPVRLPTGSITAAEAIGRTVVVTGTASDADGTPTVRIETSADGRRTTRDVLAGNGAFAAGWDGSTGTNTVCVKVLDNPTGQAVSLGCRDVVVK